MSEVSINRLWHAILPIMRTWILQPQIEKLENFLLEFKALERRQTIAVIWQMIQPEGYIFTNESFKIRTIHQYIKESPQLSIMRNTMQMSEKMDTQYMEIKYEMVLLLDDRQYDMTQHDIFEKIMQMIQISPIEIMGELTYHYTYIWMQLNFPHYNGTITIPQELTNSERVDLIVSMWAVDNIYNQEILILHGKLVENIIINRYTECDLLVQNTKDNLKFLYQRMMKKIVNKKKLNTI